MHSSTWIVVTTINSPTLAITQLAELAADHGYGVVVVGDRKTPTDWKCKGVDYFSIDEQRSRYGAFADNIPENHYCRKNLGYLYAMGNGATCILETDDDNLPYPSFGRELGRTVAGRKVSGGKWINIYAHYSKSLIWPRGLPLDSIGNRGIASMAPTTIDCSVQQYLADDDPDVDAIWRLIFGRQIKFDPGAGALIVEQDSYVPFNSQNTLFFCEAFAAMYLPCFVSFRMTDIWRSFVVQRLLWSEGGHLCFRPATVRQVRNEHNLMRDFRDEIDGYLNNARLVESLDAIHLDGSDSVADRVTLCWEALHRMNIIKDGELLLLEAWLRQVDGLS